MKRALLWGIQFYRSAISPYKGGRAAAIRPLAASTRKPPLSATGLSRVRGWRHGASCAANPFSKGGYDPVPEDPCTTLRKE